MMTPRRVPRRAMTGIGHHLRVNRMGGITMSDQNGSVPLCGMWGVPAKQGRSWSPRMTHSRPRRDRTTCSGIPLQAGGRRCRKTTLHPSGYCHVHCDAERHHRECEGHAACSVESIRSRRSRKTNLRRVEQPHLGGGLLALSTSEVPKSACGTLTEAVPPWSPQCVTRFLAA
jgi:hypothetical protein